MRSTGLMLLCLQLTTTVSAQTQSNWVGGGPDQDWNTGANWNPMMAPNNDDMNSFDVVMNRALTNLSSEITITSLVLNEGAAEGVVITGGGQPFTVEGLTVADDGRFFGNGIFDAQGGIDIFRSLQFAGSWTVTTPNLRLGTGSGADGLLIIRDDAEVTVSGMMELLRDSTIRDSGGIGARNLTIQGSFSKTGGMGLSSVSVPVTLGFGSISASTGTIDFSDDFDGAGQIMTSGSGIVRFSGTTTFDAMGFTVNDFGQVQFSAGTLENSTLTGTGDVTALVIADNGAKIKNSTIDAFNGDVPFVFAGSTMEGVTNDGFFDWQIGKVINAGFTNENGATLTTKPGALGAPEIENATVTNNGTFDIGRTLNILDQGKLNLTRGELTFSGGANIIGRNQGAQTGLITHSATIVMDAPNAIAASQITAPITSTGIFDIKKGNLVLHNTTEEKIQLNSPIVVVTGDADEFTNDGSLQIGLNNSSRSKTTGMSISVPDFGLVCWAAGIHDVEGTIVGSGDGTVAVEGTLRAAAGRSATLQIDDGATFAVDSLNANLQVDGTMTNMGRMHWFSGALIGPAASPSTTGDGTGELINEKNQIITVDPTMRISRGDGGTLRNKGLIRLAGEQFDGITMDANGLLINDSEGVITLTVQEIVRQPFGSGVGLLENHGFISHGASPPPAGESLITVNYRQTADGILSATGGLIRFFGDLIEILGGEVRAQGLGARILFQESSTTQDVMYQFLSGGIVEYGGTNATTVHEISGMLQTPGNTGEGILKLSGGTMRPQNSSAILDIRGDAKFQQAGGTLGEAGTNLINRGNAEMTGGSLVGNYDNTTTADFTLTNGLITATFINNGIFEWAGGTIDTQLTSNDELEISSDDNLFLASNARITNNDQLRHTGTGIVQLGENAEIVNATNAEYIFTSGGDISRIGGAIENARFTNTGRIANEGGISSSISVNFSSAGGTLETTGVGELNINGVVAAPNGQPMIESGFIKPGAGAINTFNAKLRGSIQHELGNGGNAEHRIPEINASLTASGDGVVNIAGGESPDGGGQFQLVPISDATVFELTGQLDMGSDATSTGAGTIHFNDTHYRLFRGSTLGSFAADTDVLFETTTAAGGAVILRGPDSGDRRPFTIAAGRTACLIGGTDVFLDGAVELTNNGTFEIKSTGGGISNRDGFDNDLRFNNNGTLAKRPDSIGLSFISVEFDNTGTVHVQDGQLNASNCLPLNGTTLERGTWILEDNTSLSLDFGASSPILTNNASITLRGADANFVNLPNGQNVSFLNDDNGTLNLEDGATFTVGGEFENDGTTTVDEQSALNVGTIDNDGSMTVNGTLGFGQESRWQSGTLGGSGTVNGTRLRNSATTSPGQSPGQLTINAEFINEPLGVIQIELAGTTAATEYDVLTINGPLTLAGTLDVVLLDGFEPTPSDTFTVIAANSISGDFDNAPNDGSGTGTLTTADGTFTVQYGATTIVLADFVPTPVNPPGDLNCDGVVSVGDINPFVLALTDPVGYAAMFPDCDPLNGDCTNDGQLTVGDINCFVALVTGG